MNDIEVQAMLGELELQRQWALTRCAQLSAALAVMTKKVDDLQKPQEVPKEESTISE